MDQVFLCQNSALCVTCCTSYALELIGRGLKIGKFSGYQDILTLTTINLHIVFSSK